MSRADRCVWRYVSRRKGTTHAYELNTKKGRSLCRCFQTTKCMTKTTPETSPLPLCCLCASMIDKFRSYAKAIS